MYYSMRFVAKNDILSIVLWHNTLSIIDVFTRITILNVSSVSYKSLYQKTKILSQPTAIQYFDLVGSVSNQSKMFKEQYNYTEFIFFFYITETILMKHKNHLLPSLRKNHSVIHRIISNVNEFDVLCYQITLIMYLYCFFFGTSNNLHRTC